jgi:hypothetical protein
MARRKKGKNKKPLPKSIDTTSIGGMEAAEETIEKVVETFEHNSTPAKKIEKVSTEKVEAAPQTYVEDTFDLDNQVDNQVEIQNEIKKKEKKFITKVELLDNPIFKNKLQKAKSRVENNKGFDFLLDFVSASKAYKTFSIDEKYDDFDIMLEELSKHFSIRLARLQLKYEDYQKITWYFERLKNLYNDYKHSEMVGRKKLNEDLEKMRSMSNLIRWNLF